MKLSLTGLLFLAVEAAVAGSSPSFDATFPKFEVNNLGIKWSAPTNNQCASLWIYKVVPQLFPPSAISNLLVMGSFTNAEFRATELVFLRNKEKTRRLKIVPAQGWIEYVDEDAPARMSGRESHRPEPVERVPDRAKVEKLALKLLDELGIQRTNLAAKPNGRPLAFGEQQTRGYMDKKRGKYVNNEVFIRGIFFDRQIDGVNFAGIGIGGGVEVEYGNNRKIAKLNIVWRNLQPYEHRLVASPDEIMRRICEGQAVMTHKNVVNPAEVKKLTVTDCSPLYMGAAGEQAQDFVYPFAQIEAIADMGNTNVPVQLYCPILTPGKDSNWK